MGKEIKLLLVDKLPGQIVEIAFAVLHSDLRSLPMTRYLVLALLAGIAAIAFGQTSKPASINIGRWQIVSTSHSVHSVFKIDTATGATFYCFAVSEKTGPNAPTDGVHCVGQR